MSLFTFIILAIVFLAVWKWFSDDIKIIIRGTINRLGLFALLGTNKGIDTIEETLNIDEVEYKKELVARFQQQ